jgi:hypothetical protein
VQQLDDLMPDPAKIGTQPHKHLSGHTVTLTNEAKQNVFGADIVLAELQRLAQRELKYFLGPGRERDMRGRRQILALANDLFDLLPDCGQADSQRFQRLGRYAVVFADQAEQDVLGADVVVVEHSGFFMRQPHNTPRLVGKPLVHRPPPRATELEMVVRREDRPGGTCPNTPVMIHPHYAYAARSKPGVIVESLAFEEAPGSSGGWRSG